jgi:hypothetical protein
MPKHLTESVAGSITATHTFTTGTCSISPTGYFKTDVISEYTTGSGVTIDSVLLKDNAVTGTTITGTNVIGTNVTGTTVTGTSIVGTNITANTAVLADTISEKTSASGVTIDSVVLKDATVSATGVTINGYFSISLSDQTFGENVGFGDFLYLKSSDSAWWKADAGTTLTMPMIGLAGATVAASFTGSVLLQGLVTYSAWSWTVGGLLYGTTGTSGRASHTAPSSAGQQVQVVGVALSATTIYFNPDYTIIEVE